jgi:hypothetical protein
MASGTLPPPVAPPRASRKVTAQPSDFIDEQIGKTRAYVKTVDIAHGLLVLATGVVAYLLVMALIDHWLVPGGLGTWGRSLAFLIVVGGASWHLVRTLVPLFMLKINPLYAAQTIEHCQPSFKNSLLSVLQLRQQRALVPEAVYNSVEAHAATRLAGVTVESTVDRSGLLRVGYVMLGVVIAASLYYLLSPKDALQTAGRVLLPWADIAPPTRVAVNDVQPGDTTVIRGQQVEVSAEVSGLREDESARIVYSTDDGQIVDRELPMSVREGGYRHIAMLPPGDERLQGSVTYRVEAGDAISPSYQVTVQPTPMIEVESISYDYPDYTAPILQDKRVEGVGDIRALEGTRVTIRCRANQEIARASIDFNCDGKHDSPMKVSGNQAAGTFVLRFADRQNLVPEFARYQIKFYNRQGIGNPEPVQHVIDVLPDLAPEVSLERPTEAIVEVPEDQAVEFRAIARDADFKLSEVLLRHEGRAGQRDAESVAMLAPEKAPWQGKFDGQLRKSPRELGYKAGDEIRYWIDAVDNKSPVDTANRASTRPATIRVLAPLRPEEKPKNEQPKNEQPQNDQPNEQNPKDNPQNQKKPDDKSAKGENEKGEDNKGEKKEGEQNADENKEEKNDKQNGEQEKGDQEEGEQEKGENEQKNDKGEKGDAADTKGEKGTQGDPGNSEEKNEGATGGANEGENQTKPQDQQQPGNNSGKGSTKSESGEGTAQEQPGGKGDKPASKNENNTGGKGGNDSTKPTGPGGAEDPSNQPAERNTAADDAEAFKELLKDREQQQAENGTKSGTPQENTGAKPDDKTKGTTTDQAPSGNNDATGAKPEEKGSTGGKPEEQKPKDPTGAGGPQTEDNPMGSGTPEKEATMNDGMGDERREGQSDKSNEGGEAKPESTEEKPDAEKGEKPSPGPGMGDPGAGSTGRPDESETGAPQSQDTNIPQHKASQQDDDNAKPSNDKEKSGSISKKTSPNSTKGEEDGDKSGGGKGGGGGDSKQPGKDSAGTQQSSPTGANASNEQGEGDTGDNKGEQVEAEGETGSSKNERGNGSAGKPDDKTEKKPGDKGKTGEGDAPPSDAASEQTPNPTGKPGENTGPGNHGPGAGQGPGNSDEPATPPPSTPAADKEDPADLDYANKATDLALEHLRDRMKSGDDQEILDKLKWTREDAQRFLANWEKIKRDATANPTTAEKRLNEELKSLGLRQGNANFTEGQATKDTQRNLSEGVKVATPAEFEDRQRAYRVGTGKK